MIDHEPVEASELEGSILGNWYDGWSYGAR